MKKLVVVFVLLFCSFNSYAQEVTTYYLVRHAEKDRSDKTNSNPELTDLGHQRALRWSSVFDNVTFDAVYSTNYLRTIATAKPTATAQGLAIQFYNPRELYSKEFQQATMGKTVLVVGHSNTTPQFVNAILGAERYSDIQDDNNANLYIVTRINEETSVVLLKIE
ncbi:histidine phosphatase family protein [Flavobacteriaceae bacterium]|nr:histidine phosphatase family protein [Flavobacteriaceae bacterium]MDC1285733.1 histidine phosphatase family protein [Flavobacteriaceae bacterium]PTM00448.1 MAG: phosphoglycerate mutase [Candidatus Arcticimaribacter sp.]